jgi:predicted phage-related endonuclease
MTAHEKIDIAADLQHSIGCSELAVALGMSSYETPFQLWERKTGRAPGKQSTLAMRLGVPMEPVIKTLYEERTGRKLRRNNKKFQHPWLPLVGHLDYEVVGEKGIVDGKSSLSFGGRSRYGADGSDELPPEHILQGQGYLMLTGKEWIDFAVLMVGPEFRIFTLKADLEIQTMIAEGIKEFWEHVINDTPPELMTLEDVSRLYKKSTLAAKAIDSQTASLLESYRELKKEIKTRELQADSYELLIKEAMGEHEALTDDQDKPLCTWKSQSSKRINTAALKEALPDIAAQYTTETNSRVFRLAKEK